MSKFISFTKYKAYLQSQGYTLQNKTIDYGAPIYMRDYVFSKEGDENIYKVTVFAKPYEVDGNLEVGDHVASINYGRGSFYCGVWKRIEADFRKKFWKELTINK